MVQAEKQRPPDDDAAPIADGARHARVPLTGNTEVELAPDPASVAQARAVTEEHCRRAGVDDGARETAVLLTSEVVTNAFLHGRSDVRLRVMTAQPGRLRVEVSDDNSRFPQLVEQRTDATNGRGLMIVHALAAAWGVQASDQGKYVWFEVEHTTAPNRPGAASPGPNPARLSMGR